MKYRLEKEMKGNKKVKKNKNRFTVNKFIYMFLLTCLNLINSSI